MEKIKRIWEENKVLLVLAIVLIACLFVLIVVSITYFYGTSKTVYGNRLDEIKEVKLSNTLFDDIKKEIEENDKVEKVETGLKGKIVYINIEFVTSTKMDDAKKIAESIIDFFSENELKVYDINFVIYTSKESDDAYTLMGARNANGSGIVWSNYNIKESAE